MTAALTSFVTTCPAWCGLPAGHDDGPDSRDPHDGSRYIRHRALVGVDVELEQLVVVGADGAVEIFPPAVVVGGHEHDLNRARQLFDELARALITAGGR